MSLDALRKSFQVIPLTEKRPTIDKNWIDPSLIPKLERIDSETEARRYKDSKGREYLSVTSLLSLMEDFESSRSALVGWENYHGKEEAARLSRIGALRGTAVHQALEDWIQNKPLTTLSGNPLYARLFNQIVEVIHSRVHSFLASELQVRSSMGFAGTLDACGYVWNESHTGLNKCIIDFKNYGRAKETRDVEQAFYQTALYSLALEESTGVIAETALIIASNETDSKASCFYLGPDELKHYQTKALTSAIRTLGIYNGKRI